jgi:rSAM/selenodomain-associated transferase 1
VNVLELFAKWPRLGAVKTRLANETNPAFAVRIADAFLRDSLVRLATVEAQRIVAFAPPEERSNFANLAGNLWQLEPQCNGDLGARLTEFFSRRFQDGAWRVVAVGSDSPTLPLDYVHAAFAQLESADVVLGPATDGGYYLVGTSSYVPELFADIRWSSADVLRQTIARINPSQKLALLPLWYDVDTLDDWRMLLGHVAALRRAGIDPLAAHTEKLTGSSEF